MRHLGWVVIVLLFVSPVAARGGGATAQPKSAAFERLQSLVGAWKEAGPAKGFSVRFERVAGGTAIMETLTEPGGSTMVTLYHPDGGTILLTHYCDMGDQPRMRGDLAADSIAFSFVDVTNLSGPDVPHMHDLTISWKGPDHIVERWIVAAGNKRTPLVLDLKRVTS
jgi:hypothetical protein